MANLRVIWKRKLLSFDLQAGAPVRGRTWALAESEPSGGPTSLDFFEQWRRRIGNDACLPPTIVTQHMEVPRRLIALTVQVSEAYGGTMGGFWT